MEMSSGHDIIDKYVQQNESGNELQQINMSRCLIFILMLLIIFSLQISIISHRPEFHNNKLKVVSMSIRPPHSCSLFFFI